MNPNWRFKIVLTLLTLYVIGINCQNEKGELKKDDDKITFNSNETIGKDKSPRLNCKPDDICKKANLTSVLCKGDFANLKDKKYNCTSDQLTKSNVKFVNYTVNCPAQKEDKNEEEIDFKQCWLNVTLTNAPKPDDKGSSAGLIIGIIILVIAALIGIVAFLGYRGVGPMRGFFNN